MKHYPRTTIGLCVKNRAETIKQCIESVVHQDYPHKFIEIIVVDGCSRDATLSIVKRILSKTDIRSRIFFENEGLGRARQIIVDESDGDYIIWIDSDMVIPKNYVRKHADFMENNPNVGIATGEQIILSNDNLVSKLEHIFRVMSLVKWRRTPTPKMVATVGSIYRIRAIKKVGGFYVRMKSGEDIEISYRIRQAGWLICRNTQNIFYERFKFNLWSLWKKYSWYGYGWRSLIHKMGYSRVLIKGFPLIGFIEGLVLSNTAYKMIGKRWVFILPLHRLFVRTAWYFGLIKAYLSHLSGD